MAWNKLKFPTMTLRPSRDMLRKSVLAGLLAAGFIGAFYWGRQGGLSEARASETSGLPDAVKLLQTAQGQVRNNREVVAHIYETVPVTRNELAEYLIERFGAERIEFLVNRKIIDLCCQSQKIFVSDAEIKAQLDEDLKGFGCTEREFVNNVLKKYNKSLFEWKEDVIRPKLALQRYVKDKIVITQDDIQKAFEARYGEKVECRLIALSKEQSVQKHDIWTKVRGSAEEFDKMARNQFLHALASEAGKIPPVHRHFGDKNIEAEAFKLQPGEISPLIGMPDGTTVILQCVKRLPADTTKRIDQVHMELHRDLVEIRLQTEIPKLFAEMRKQANPQIYLKRDGSVGGDPNQVVGRNAPGTTPRLQSPVQPGQQPAMPSVAVTPPTSAPQGNSIDQPLPAAPPGTTSGN